MNATRAATIRGRAAFGSTVVSLGRVQTPTLAILVRREKEIQAFEPTPYWLVDATFQPRRRQALATAAATCAAARRTSRPPRTPTRSSSASTARAHITSLSKRTQRSQPPLLYDLTALQREARRVARLHRPAHALGRAGLLREGRAQLPAYGEPLPLRAT